MSGNYVSVGKTEVTTRLVLWHFLKLYINKKLNVYFDGVRLQEVSDMITFFTFTISLGYSFHPCCFGILFITKFTACKFKTKLNGKIILL